MANQDYTTADDQTDTNLDLTIAAGSITVDTMTRDVKTRVAWDMGADYFDGVFEHSTKVNVDTARDYGSMAIWGVANVLDEYESWTTDNEEGIRLAVLSKSGNPAPGYQFQLVETKTANSDASLAGDSSFDTDYWTEIERTSGTATEVRIYSSMGPPVLYDTISVVHADESYRYGYGLIGRDTGHNLRYISGVVSDLNWGEDEPTTTTTEGVTTSTTEEVTTSTTEEGGTTSGLGGLNIYVGGEVTTDLTLRRIAASYTRPWEAELAWAGRHDEPPAAELWDDVRVARDGVTLFRGNITEVSPGGVAGEGIVYRAQCRRFRLASEPVRINGRSHYVWNRRGTACNEGQGGEDSPGQDGGKWTAGEIIVDILEHALGVPGGGSDIAGHHGAAGCATATYLTSADVSGYSAATILTLDSMVGEFSVDDTPVADAIGTLLGLNGGFWGWYIDPTTGALVVQDLDALATTDIEAGELGQWQDAGGTDYKLLGNTLSFSLDGVFSTIRIQGTDKTSEEQPANIEGDANAGAGNLGKLELVDAPWRGFNAAYRALAQPTRRFTGKDIDAESDYTPPDGYYSYGHKPRIYEGTDAGSKTVYAPSSGVHSTWMLPSGMIGFYEVPSLGEGESLWGWYWAEVPFVVEAGPEGTAYDFYGYERVRTVYDPAFRHTTGWPQPGTADDETAMGVLAARLLRLYRDVRRQGRLVCDGADPATFGLAARYSVRNLADDGTTTTTPGPSTTTAAADPMHWSRLEINAVEVTWDFERDLTEITVANTFFMLPEYSELKRRLETNLFAQRELDLSERIYECQVHSPVAQIDADDLTTTTTEATTTSTDPPACTDNTMGTTSHGDAALADTWNINDGCLALTLMVDRKYSETAEVFYNYYRTFTITADGRVVAGSAETRVTGAEPEECCT